MRKTYYASAGLTLDYDQGQKTAYAVWNGFLNSQEFKEATLKCLQLMEEEGVVRWLADNRKMKAIRQADQHWFVENIMPRMLQSTLRRMATLVSEDMFNKMAVDQIMQRIEQPDHLVLRDFNDEAQALAWLMMPLTEQGQRNSKESNG
ncbi:STAS/SEC14 domain-containing protein [Rufibacter tibetensis]|uniref:STAS/SEC14 domain-containing protein n=1 Tax=Rufibacter tibetensis TaxID=512763 RepID=A0A0P0C2B7_9BACT|nr:STAS/SEC14 domain-containing protein [Rufibacter tibetensis]ALI99132.1 hypothetical protein DC20_09295 [Rufibacter tibetensis]